MRTRTVAALLAAALCLPIAAGTVEAAHHGHPDLDVHHGDNPDVNFWGEDRVEEGEVHEGDIVSIFGKVRVTGKVTGDIVVILGDLDLSGSAEGDVVSLMSRTRVAPTARVGGDLVNIGWSLIGSTPREQVGGELVNIKFMPWSAEIGVWPALMRLWFLFKLMKMSALFLILLLITALVPRRLALISAAFPQRWGHAILAGLLAYAGLAVGAFLLVVTVIGIPLAVALGGALLVIKWLGLASLLFLIGHTAGRNLFGRELPHLASVLGGFAAYAVLCLIPLFGFTFSLVMNVFAVGIAIVTQFGAEDPWRRGGAGPAGVQPPAAPAAPGEAVPPRL